jgi:hypothetical protein
MSAKLYHCGIRSTISRSTLADANEHRPWQLYHDVAQILIQQARELYRDETFFKELKSAVYAFDSTTIEVCLKLFPWAIAAGHTNTSAGMKLHTLLDLQSKIPVFIRVSAARIHDMYILDELIYEAGAYYVFDRGYMDFARLKKVDLASAFFVIRAKRALRFQRLYSHSVDKAHGIIADQTIRLLVWRTQQQYPDHLRRIRFYDEQNNRTLIFLTNNFQLDAETIAQLYHSRWHIELFFKWIKQHLRIKAFYGTSINAVKTQIWIAVCVYVMVAIIKKNLKLDLSLYTILQILSITLFEKEPIYQALTASQHIIDTPDFTNQLILFDV